MYILTYVGNMDDMIIGSFKNKRDAIRKAKKLNLDKIRKFLNGKYGIDCSTFISYKIVSLDKRGRINKVEVIDL